MKPDNSPAPTPESKNQRLFFALWPPLELSRELYSVAGRVLEGDGRRVPPENIHLTLAFLGSVNARFRDCIIQAASMIRVTPFSVLVEQMGHWPKSGILWAGPRQTPEPLCHLVRAMNDGLAHCGHEAESHPYVAHLTLARQARPPQDIYFKESPVWEIDRFHLVESHTHSSGARYEILQYWPLSPPPA